MFLYYEDENTLNAEKDKLVQELYVDSHKEVENGANDDNDKKLANQLELEKLNKLDESIYYNKDLIPFTLSLYYMDSDKNISTTANFVKSSLKELGIEINLVPFVLNDLTRILVNKNEYDMLIT
ncbi:MAG: hypothetical protein LBU14_03595 [Candidatus Peribacteria bacterium]|jgi:hypothetical protein|nr:hypothetical protein [Candidatus Peribacteria bacterium]